MKMAQANRAIITAIENQILENAAILGNSKRGLKELASDLINDYGRGNKKGLVEGTYLSAGTLDRLAECDEMYRPQAESIERVLKFFGCELSAHTVVIGARYRNKEKQF